MFGTEWVQQQEEGEISAQVAKVRKELVSMETEFRLDVQQCAEEGLSAEEQAELDQLGEEASAKFRSMSESLNAASKKLDIMSGKGYRHFGPHGFASMGWGHGVGNDRCLQCGHTLRHRIHVGPSVRWWKQPDGSYGAVRPEGADDFGIWVVLVLLCYKKSRRQQGHLGRERARWVAIWRRTVAIEQGLCRSVRTGRAAGRVPALHMG